jgi:hypothetical protein
MLVTCEQRWRRVASGWAASPASSLHPVDRGGHSRGLAAMYPTVKDYSMKDSHNYIMTRALITSGQSWALIR